MGDWIELEGGPGCCVSGRLSVKLLASSKEQAKHHRRGHFATELWWGGGRLRTQAPHGQEPYGERRGVQGACESGWIVKGLWAVLVQRA